MPALVPLSYNNELPRVEAVVARCAYPGVMPDKAPLTPVSPEPSPTKAVAFTVPTTSSFWLGADELIPTFPVVPMLVPLVIHWLDPPPPMRCTGNGLLADTAVPSAV